jgi:transposase
MSRIIIEQAEGYLYDYAARHIMNLDEAQRKKAAEWIKQGLRLSDIQNRLASELGLRLTYMEVRLLVDDLKLVPKDIEPAKPSGALLASSGAAAAAAPGGRPSAASAGAAAKPSPGRVSVSVDQLARPGAMVSGKVTFSDGNSADWYLDQSGQLGLVPKQAGYRPPPADVQQFQMALDAELNRMGF